MNIFKHSPRFQPWNKDCEYDCEYNCVPTVEPRAMVISQKKISNTFLQVPEILKKQSIFN